MQSDQVTIYALIDPRDESTRYVGQTRQPLEQRLAQHCAERVMGRKGTWIAELEALGLRPVIMALEVVAATAANAAERMHVRRLRASGADLANGVVHRRVQFPWRCMVCLTAEEGAWLEQLAREREIPIAILLRHIVREYQEQQGNGRDGHNRRCAQQQQEGKP